MISLNNIHDYKINAVDGKAGKVLETLIDDNTWDIVYFVVNTDVVLNPRLVVIKPESAIKTDEHNKVISVSLTREEVFNSTSLFSVQGINKDKYSWPYYWLGTGAGFPSITPSSTYGLAPVSFNSHKSKTSDNGLISSRDLLKYKTMTKDHYELSIREFLVNDDLWQITDAQVKIERSLFSSKSVLVDINSIEGADNRNKHLLLNLKMTDVKNLRVFEPVRSYDGKEYKHSYKRLPGLYSSALTDK